jgi:hypothetical protein
MPVLQESLRYCGMSPDLVTLNSRRLALPCSNRLWAGFGIKQMPALPRGWTPLRLDAWDCGC